MKNTEKEKPTTDQVILQMEPQTHKTRQSPRQSPQSDFHSSPIDQTGEDNNYNNKTSNSPLPPRPALRRLSFSKPKSRFIETKYPPPSTTTRVPIFESTEELNEPPLRPQDNNNNNNNNPSSESDEEDEDIWNEEGEAGENGREQYRKKKRKLGWRIIVEWVSFVVIMTGLICSLTLKSLKGNTKWGLEIWKWCLMVMVVFCGRLVSGWVMGIAVFFIEKNYILREKVLYFVHGLRKSVQNCVWLALVLLAWMFMFSSEVQRHNKIFKKVFRFLLGVLIGATIWLIKIILVKLLASSFHVATFFDRMKESAFHHYILDTLSGDPLDVIEDQRLLSKRRGFLTPSKSLPARLKDSGRKLGSRRIGGSGRKIDIEKLRKLSMQSTASAWGVKRLVSYIMSSGLSTISRSVDEFGNSGSEITSEWEARNAAQKIFKNVAKPGAKFIEEDDLLKFLSRDEVHTIFPFFEGALETGQIRKSAFRNWVVQAYVERRALAHSLNDTKTAVQQLHKLASAIVLVVIAIVLLLVMGVATSKVIVVVSSQLLLVGFMFQNTCKTIFESIVFVFVMHPFDTGDRCVIDGTQMIVEEMNILTTVFLRYDNEKIYYPNSVLSTKPISNFYRSPDMADMINFTIDVSTSVDNVTALKKAIQGYIEGKPKHWIPKHMVLVKEIENVDRMHMSLCVTHTMNHQNFVERSLRRSELVFELKKIFDNLGIKYHVLPQEVHLSGVQTSNNCSCR